MAKKYKVYYGVLEITVKGKWNKDGILWLVRPDSIEERMYSVIQLCEKFGKSDDEILSIIMEEFCLKENEAKKAIEENFLMAQGREIYQTGMLAGIEEAEKRFGLRKDSSRSSRFSKKKTTDFIQNDEATRGYVAGFAKVYLVWILGLMRNESYTDDMIQDAILKGEIPPSYYVNDENELRQNLEKIIGIAKEAKEVLSDVPTNDLMDAAQYDHYKALMFVPCVWDYVSDIAEAKFGGGYLVDKKKPPLTLTDKDHEIVGYIQKARQDGLGKAKILEEIQEKFSVFKEVASIYFSNSIG